MRICFLFCLFLSSLSIGAQGILPFNNSDLPVEERAQDLLQRLTLQEKVLLMCDYSSPDGFMHLIYIPSELVL